LIASICLKLIRIRFTYISAIKAIPDSFHSVIFGGEIRDIDDKIYSIEEQDDG
jgi:hypothetical protein